MPTHSKEEVVIWGIAISGVLAWIVKLCLGELFIRRSTMTCRLREQRDKYEAEIAALKDAHEKEQTQINEAFHQKMANDWTRAQATIRDMQTAMTLLATDVKAITMRLQMPGAASQDQEHR